MDFAELASSDVIDQLRCSMCKNLLSCFPVFSSIDYLICGRCSPIQNNCIRNTAYEAISQFVKFPCRYEKEGCWERVLPKDMLHHEEVCDYKSTKCPFTDSDSCLWQGSFLSLAEHCEVVHSDTILENREFEINLSNSWLYKNLIKHNNQLFIFLRKFNAGNNTLEYLVTPLEKTKSYSYKLIAEYNDTSLSVKRSTEIMRYEDDKKIFSHISIESIICMTSADTITGKIYFHEDKKDEINLNMLSIIKCSTCLKYALPPIRQCGKHKIILCVKCRNKHTFGRKSRCNIFLKNTELDKMARLLNYPCRYRVNGCDFVSKSDKIDSHQVICRYRSLLCPLHKFANCSWNGFNKDVKVHIQNDHQNLISNAAKHFDIVVKTDELPIVPLSGIEILNKSLDQWTSGTVIFFNVIIFANRLFMLVCRKQINDYCWELKMIGQFDSSFIFEIEIIDRNSNGRSISIRQLCSSVIPMEQFSHCCTRINENQIKSLVSDRILTFKVKFFKYPEN